MKKNTQSLKLAKDLLGQNVVVTIDRPINSTHPKWGFVYACNYGFIQGIKAPDGEDLDAYLLGINQPVSQYSGIVVAIIHRLEDDDDKLIVVPKDHHISDEEIEEIVNFQEKWFKHQIIR